MAIPFFGTTSEMVETEIERFERFPAKLWKMINSAQNGAIQWGTSGKTVLIEIESFQDKYLNKSVFKTCNMQSFTRQLNLYGFRNVKIKERDPMRNPRDKRFLEFYHESFQCHNRDLAVSLSRKNKTSKKKRIIVKDEAASTGYRTATQCQKMIEDVVAKPQKVRIGKRANCRKVAYRLEDNGDFRKRVVESMLPQVEKSRSNLIRVLYQRYEEFAQLHEIYLPDILEQEAVAPMQAEAGTPVDSGILVAGGSAVGLRCKKRSKKAAAEPLYRIDFSPILSSDDKPDAAAPSPDSIVHVGELVAAYLVLEESRATVELMTGGQPTSAAAAAANPGSSRQCVLLLIDQSNASSPAARGKAAGGERTLGWAVLELEGSVALDTTVALNSASMIDGLAGIDEAMAEFDIPDGFGITVAAIDGVDSFIMHDVTEAIAGMSQLDGFELSAGGTDGLDAFVTQEVTEVIAGFDGLEGFEVIAESVECAEGLVMQRVAGSIADLDGFEVATAVYSGPLVDEREPDDVDGFHPTSALEMDVDDPPEAVVASPDWGVRDVDMPTSMSGLYHNSPQSGASHNSKTDVRGMSLVPVEGYEEETWDDRGPWSHGTSEIQNNDPDFLSLIASFNPSSEDAEPNYEEWYNGSPFEDEDSSTKQYFPL